MEYKFNVIDRLGFKEIVMELPEYECKNITSYIGFDSQSRYPYYRAQLVAGVESLQATQVLLVGDDFDKRRMGMDYKDIYKVSSDFIELLKKSDTLLCLAYVAASYEVNAANNHDAPPSNKKVFAHLYDILRLYLANNYTFDSKDNILAAISCLAQKDV